MMIKTTKPTASPTARPTDEASVSTTQQITFLTVTGGGSSATDLSAAFSEHHSKVIAVITNCSLIALIPSFKQYAHAHGYSDVQIVLLFVAAEVCP